MESARDCIIPMTMLDAPPAPPPPTDEHPVVEPAPPKRRRWPFVLAALLGVLVAGAGAAAAWLATQFPHAELHGHQRALAQLELPGMGTSSSRSPCTATAARSSRCG